MSHIVYHQAFDHTWLYQQLLVKTRAQLSRETGIPFNSINNQFKKLTPTQKAEILRARFTWSPDQKLAILKDAEIRGYEIVSEEMGITRSLLSRWKREMSQAGLFTPKRTLYGRPKKYGRK